ncbi:MAG TPA: hypothetical protein VLI04_20655 [Nocardioidaceae bacterium]|nr:hypothetical protein [Nocardioidaceae bacterium]
MSLSIDRRDAPPSNVVGNSISITLFTTLKWWGGTYMRGLLWLPRHARKLMVGEMDSMSFISFASWTVLNRPGMRRRLFFEVHFNGGWEQYVEASVRVLTRGMKLFWGSSKTYPGPLPAGPFLEFFRNHEVACTHYYCAYPEATVTEVRRAIELEGKLDAFTAEARRLGDEDFESHWRTFLGETQQLL